MARFFWRCPQYFFLLNFCEIIIDIKINNYLTNFPLLNWSYYNFKSFNDSEFYSCKQSEKTPNEKQVKNLVGKQPKSLDKNKEKSFLKGKQSGHRGQHNDLFRLPIDLLGLVFRTSDCWHVPHCWCNYRFLAILACSSYLKVFERAILFLFHHNWILSCIFFDCQLLKPKLYAKWIPHLYILHILIIS